GFFSRATRKDRDSFLQSTSTALSYNAKFFCVNCAPVIYLLKSLFHMFMNFLQKLVYFLCSYETEQELLKWQAWWEKTFRRWYENVEKTSEHTVHKEKLLHSLRSEIYDSKTRYSIYDVFE
ncbi:unnamed protein product, partial [Amoebophrya sp. A120]